MKQYNSYDAVVSLRDDFDKGLVHIHSCEWEDEYLVLSGFRGTGSFKLKIWDVGDNSEAFRVAGKLLQRQMKTEQDDLRGAVA